MRSLLSSQRSLDVLPETSRKQNVTCRVPGWMITIILLCFVYIGLSLSSHKATLSNYAIVVNTNIFVATHISSLYKGFPRSLVDDS